MSGWNSSGARPVVMKLGEWYYDYDGKHKQFRELGPDGYYDVNIVPLKGPWYEEASLI